MARTLEARTLRIGLPPKPRRRWRAGIPSSGMIAAKLLRSQIAEVAEVARCEFDGNVSAAARALISEALLLRTLSAAQRKSKE